LSLALQPWAEISERLRRNNAFGVIWFKFQLMHYLLMTALVTHARITYAATQPSETIDSAGTITIFRVG